MKTFAYLIHSPVKFIPVFLLKFFAKNTWPFIVFRIKNVPSAKSKEARGFFIVLPVSLGRTHNHALEAMDKILSAGELAKKLGSHILGLGGYASLFCDKGYTAIRTLKIPVTSGSTFTAWSAFEAIYRTARIKKLDLSKTTIAVVNAASAIGSLCSRKLSAYVSKITLNSHPELEFKLQHLKETILQLNSLEVDIHISTPLAVRQADIVIFTDDMPEAELNISDLKPKAIICDASVARVIAAKAKSRRDITVIEAGLIKMPKPVKFSVNTGLPRGIISASMAEAMLLTLEGKFSNYSLGENINLDKMEEIADIATRYGFEVWVPEAPIL